MVNVVRVSKIQIGEYIYWLGEPQIIEQSRDDDEVRFSVKAPVASEGIAKYRPETFGKFSE